MSKVSAVPKLSVVLALVTLCGATLCLNSDAKASPNPMSKEAIIKLLKGDVSPNRVAQLAREHGIDFQVTADVENELRQAGATEGLMKVLRELAPKPPVETPRRASPTPTVGTVSENPKDGLKYVWIPPGSFQMGCSPHENNCYDWEKPAHQVTISKGFWLGQMDVMVGAYKRFTASVGWQMPPSPAFNSGWTSDNMPIVNVTWDEARDYCTWAVGRLPTEAEWEYAARGGNTAASYLPPDEIAWYTSNSGGRTHIVGEKRANGFGLYDMLGNVWGWVNDWYDANYYENSPSQDPTGPRSGTARVLRGGSWSSDPGVVPVSYRGRFDPGGRSDYFGFRCVGEVVSP